MENIDGDKSSEDIKNKILSIHVRIYLRRGEKQLAIETIAQSIVTEPENLTLRTIQIRIYRLLGDHNSAIEALEKALILVNDQTDLPTRLNLSFEARRVGCDDVMISLLKDRVATDHENEGLYALIAASIQSNYWVTTREILDSVSQTLHEQSWFKKAEAILAINTGNIKAEGMIVRYLKQCPNDLEMLTSPPTPLCYCYWYGSKSIILYKGQGGRRYF
jgi:tetratricopeptide (TPR) repeat protein